VAIGAVAVLAVVVAGCGGGGGGGSSSNNTTTSSNTSVKGSVKFWGIWSAEEQKAFQKVIAAFEKQYPNVKVNYTSKGDNIPTILATAIAGGSPPDIADVAQPGLVTQLVQQGHLKPITYAKSTIDANFSPGFVKLGEVNGKLYALLYKASNKSTLWYNVPAFKQAGVQPTKALTYMKQIVGDTSNIYGGESGAIQTAYPQCVDYVYTSPPKAAMVPEADFVANEILQATKAKPKTGFNVVPFPTIAGGAGANAIETSGDEIITFRDTPAIEAFVKYLATPQAAEIWAKLGGFGTGNKNVPPSVYPDPITKETETPIATAKAAVFDMSDQQPASFGATTGQGEWGLFQSFLQTPSDISGIQQKLEQAAAKAYKSGK
jgi:alpha-glucoside transport system substrate-binding protein